MKQGPLCKVLMIASLFLISSPTWAEDVFNQPGAYVGLGMAGGLSNFDGAAHGAGNSPGFDVCGGYRFTDNVAVEALYEYMNDFEKGRHDAPGNAHLSTNNVSVMGKLLAPVPGLTNLQPYVSGGIGFLNVDGAERFSGPEGAVHHVGSGTELAGRVDGGVDYFLTPQISTFLDAGYVMPTEHLDHLDYVSLSLGVKYNF